MRPNFAIIEKYRTSKDNYVGVFRVDTNKATYQGKKWYTLFPWQKRAFEDLLALTHASDGLIKVLYT